MLTERLGHKNLTECMEAVSEFEYEVWMAHFQLEWERPSRADWYAMQTAAWCRANATGRAVDTRDMQIPFVEKVQVAQTPYNGNGTAEGHDPFGPMTQKQIDRIRIAVRMRELGGAL